MREKDKEIGEDGLPVKLSMADIRKIKVLELVSRSWPTGQIVQKMNDDAEGGWSQSTIEGDIKWAKAQIKSAIAITREEALKQAIAYWENFLYRAQQKEDLYAEIRAREHFDKILGLLDGNGVSTSDRVSTIKIVDAAKPEENKPE